jgi:hypothetical protein
MIPKVTSESLIHSVPISVSVRISGDCYEAGRVINIINIMIIRSAITIIITIIDVVTIAINDIPLRIAIYDIPLRI